jgi:peptidoglycan/LPS O-acetylase OafA/YrhL
MFFLGVLLYVSLSQRLPIIGVWVSLVSLSAWFLWQRNAEGITVLLTAIAIFAVGAAGRFSNILANRPLQYLGKISYSLYLLHMVVGLNLLQILSAWAERGAVAAWCAWGLAIAASLGAAVAMHYVVEAPSNRLSQRITRRRPAPAMAWT